MHARDILDLLDRAQADSALRADLLADPIAALERLGYHIDAADRAAIASADWTGAGEIDLQLRGAVDSEWGFQKYQMGLATLDLELPSQDDVKALDDFMAVACELDCQNRNLQEPEEYNAYCLFRDDAAPNRYLFAGGKDSAASAQMMITAAEKIYTTMTTGWTVTPPGNDFRHVSRVVDARPRVAAEIEDALNTAGVGRQAVLIYIPPLNNIQDAGEFEWLASRRMSYFQRYGAKAWILARCTDPMGGPRSDHWIAGVFEKGAPQAAYILGTLNASSPQAPLADLVVGDVAKLDNDEINEYKRLLTALPSGARSYTLLKNVTMYSDKPRRPECLPCSGQSVTAPPQQPAGS